MQRTKPSRPAEPLHGEVEEGDNDKMVVAESSEDPAEKVVLEKVELKQSITFFGVIAILISNIGGSGVFITPTTILRFSGSPGMSVLMWALGGVVQASLAFCAIEVALMFNKAGGPYYFIYYTFGDMAGFVFMWGFVIFIAAPSWALGSYTAGLYTLSLVYTDCQPPEALVKLVSLWLMVSLIALNCTHMKVIANIQKVLTLCKLLALVIIIIVGIVLVPSETGQENLSSFMEGTTTNVGNIALALFAGFFGFGGWPVITILAEEVKDPVKNVPRGLTVSFAVLIFTMMATNFAYYVVLSKEEALKSDAVATLFGQMVHPSLHVILSILVSLCSIGTLNVLIMGQPRLLFAAGRNGHMPRIMTMLHKKYNTPWPAIWTMGIVATVMLATGSILSLLSAISLFAAILTVSMIMCLFFLRWKQPETHRPIKIPLVVPVIVSLISMTILIISIIAEPKALVINLVIIILAVPVYFLCFKCKAIQKRLTFMDRIGVILERLFLLQYET